MIHLLFAIAADLLSSGDKQNSSGDGSNHGYSDEGNSYSGRWSQNEINVRDNIEAGMAVKDD